MITVTYVLSNGTQEVHRLPKILPPTVLLHAFQTADGTIDGGFGVKTIIFST